MTVTIWHNPKCSTSRKVLDALRARGIEPVIFRYLDTPPSQGKLKAVLKAMGAAPRDLLRKKEALYKDLGLDKPGATDAEVLALMAEHPILIERPIVETKKGARLCRPIERFEEIM